MEENTTLLKSIRDNVSAAGHEGAPVSLTYDLPVMLVVAVLLTILTSTTVAGNLLVGLALLRYPRLRSVSNCLIGNLALSDFLLAVTVLPLSAAYECLGRWIFGRLACDAWLIVDVLYCTASIWNLCVIAADRFTATRFPIWYRDQRSARRAGVYVAVVWVVATAACVPPMIGWTDQQNFVWKNDSSFQCEPYQTPGPFVGEFYHSFTLFYYLIRSSKSCRRKTARCFMSLNISLSHPRSLKVIQNGTIRKLVYGFIVAFHSN